jgi:hypothetical protein
LGLLLGEAAEQLSELPLPEIGHPGSTMMVAATKKLMLVIMSNTARSVLSTVIN